MTSAYKHISLTLLLLMVMSSYAVMIHSYKINNAGYRLSNLDKEEFCNIMKIEQDEIELTESHEVTYDQIRKMFGQQGARNLKTMGIINPTAHDLIRKREEIAPGVKPRFREHTSLNNKIYNYSVLRGLDPAFVMALVRTESNFHPNAKSHAGAMGLMQIMPTTASHVSGIKVSESMLKNPETNLFIGTYHLRDLLIKYRDPITALSAWNAGETAVKRYGRVPPYPETIAFGKSVMSHYKNYKKDPPWKK